MDNTKEKAGLRWRFAYPIEFVTLPDHTAHAGQIVTALRKLRAPDVDEDPDMECMYEIEALDGWRGEAFDSELEPIATDNLDPAAVDLALKAMREAGL